MNAEKDQIIADKEDELAAREEQLNEKEAAIQALKDEITESNEYLAEIENTVDEVLSYKKNLPCCALNTLSKDSMKHQNSVMFTVLFLLSIHTYILSESLYPVQN